MARRVTLGLLIAAAAFLALTHGADVATFVTTARGGSVPWLAVAAVLQVGREKAWASCHIEIIQDILVSRKDKTINLDD